MFRKQSFWKGSALLLASAMTAKLLGACFKIPLTNVLGGTGMGYFSTAYGLLLPVYALSVTGLSAAVAQTVSRAAALEHWSEVRRIHHAARLACGALGLLLSLCMFLLAEPFATQIAAQPPCPVLSACHCTGGTVRLPDCRGTGLLGGLAEYDPHGVVAGTGSGGEAGLRTGTVHVGAPESGGRLPPGAAGGASFGTGCRGSRAGCHAVYSAGVGVLPAAWSAAGYPTAQR